MLHYQIIQDDTVIRNLSAKSMKSIYNKYNKYCTNLKCESIVCEPVISTGCIYYQKGSDRYFLRPALSGVSD